MASEVVAAAVGAVLGAVATYVIDVHKERSDRRQAAEAAVAARQELRQSIATALIQDLRTLEPLLRQFYHARKPGAWVGESPSLFFHAMRSQVHRLRADSIPPIVDFFRRAEDVFAMLNAVSPEMRSHDGFNYRLRVQAGFALQSLPEAKVKLLDNGGQIPEPRILEVVQNPELPTIPQRVFPDLASAGAELPEELR